MAANRNREQASTHTTRAYECSHARRLELWSSLRFVYPGYLAFFARTGDELEAEVRPRSHAAERRSGNEIEWPTRCAVKAEVI